MNPIDPIIEKKSIDKLFLTSMVIKAGAAVFEIGTGIATLFLTTNEVLRVTQMLVQGKLDADPDDFLANYVLDLAARFVPGQSNWFLFSYLVGHGVINMLLVIALLRKKMWAYPVSLVIFGSFLVYEGWKVLSTHSLFMSAFTVFDLAVIWLISREYRYALKRRGK